MNWNIIMLGIALAVAQVGLLSTAYNLGSIHANVECIKMNLDRIIKEQNQ